MMLSIEKVDSGGHIPLCEYCGSACLNVHEIKYKKPMQILGAGYTHHETWMCEKCMKSLAEEIKKCLEVQSVEKKR